MSVRDWTQPVLCVVKRCGCAWIIDTGEQIVVCCFAHYDAVQLLLPFQRIVVVEEDHEAFID